MNFTRPLLSALAICFSTYSIAHEGHQHADEAKKAAEKVRDMDRDPKQFLDLFPFPDEAKKKVENGISALFTK